MPRLDEILQNTQSSDPQIEELLSKLKLFYQKRFWYEFSETLTILVYQKQAFNSKAIIEGTIEELSVYNDPVLMVELLDLYLIRYTIDDLSIRLALIKKARETFSRSEIAQEFLNIIEAKVNILAGNFEEGVKLQKKVESNIEILREIPKTIYSALQLTKSLFFWSKNDFDNYYIVAVKCLAYLDEKKLSQEQQTTFAEQIIEAGLINNQTLSFGSLMDNQIFSLLKLNPNKKVLFDLLEIFSQGKVELFDNYLLRQGNSLAQFPLIGANLQKLKRKIRVIAFYDCVFFNQKRDFEQLSLSFQEIAQIAQVNLAEVEKLIVYVLSIGIFQGYIDEVDQKFYISRIKPQELDQNRLIQLKANFDNWKIGIQSTIEFINKC